MDRAQLDWLHYKREASHSAKLTDEERWAQMRDLYEAYLAFQRTKSAEQIARERRAEWRLNRGKLNPRYRALREAAAWGDGVRESAAHASSRILAPGAPPELLSAAF